MSAVEELPDVEGALVAFLKANTAVAALVATRVFYGIPKATPVWPLVTVARIGGGDDASDAPVDEGVLQVDCWGTISTSGYGQKLPCTQLKNAVRSALRSFTGGVLATGVYAGGITVQSDIWLPDPADDRPRYSLIVELAALSIPV